MAPDATHVSGAIPDLRRDSSGTHERDAGATVREHAVVEPQLRRGPARQEECIQGRWIGQTVIERVASIRARSTQSVLYAGACHSVGRFGESTREERTLAGAELVEHRQDHLVNS